MNASSKLISIVFALSVLCTHAATLYVNVQNLSPVLPFAGWASAATNIQDAIDAASPGDVVLVTNGVYQAGGKVISEGLINRVAVDKPIIVQSVNGPWFTTIRGAGATNGTAAVRGAWLTNGAVLKGFTVTAGATRTAGDPTNSLSGGGVFCAGTNAVVANCIVVSNTSTAFGGGVYGGFIQGSAVVGNKGVGVSRAVLASCTVVSNTSLGIAQSKATNCIVYYNSSGNHQSSAVAYSCIFPLDPTMGENNFAAAPLLDSDGIHILESSPCREAGNTMATGTDIDGEAWRSPPSVGCDEWDEFPRIQTQPALALTTYPLGFRLTISARGMEPFAYRWLHNGAAVEADTRFNINSDGTLQAPGISETDAGTYQVVVSNAYGVVTSAVARLVPRFVNVSNASPETPYLSWATAATNIQDAIDAASEGDLVLVASGVYRSGGRVMGGGLTNRVAVYKKLIVQSIHGPGVTVIEGPALPNGPLGVRCAWLTNGAALSGFTLTGGSTRPPVAIGSQEHSLGGGIFATSTNAAAHNCVLTNNLAGYMGGGAFVATLVDCTLIGNRAVGSGNPGSGIGSAGSGGAAANSNLKNCVVKGNFADQSSGGGTVNCGLVNCALLENSSFMNGGAASGGWMVNCTVTRNTASGYTSGYGAAVYSAAMTNCVVWGNYSRTAYPNTNYVSPLLVHCLTSPLAEGPGNIDTDPQLQADGIHVAESSPCRGAGLAVATGADLDGEAWANPPSIGCDEWHGGLVLSSGPTLRSAPLRRVQFEVTAGGQLPISYTWYRNGQVLQDDANFKNANSAGPQILNISPEHAGEYFVVVSNSFGRATSEVVRVCVSCVDAASAQPAAPFSSWDTAAADIQTAIDAAVPGQIILVTNGVYARGGKVMSGDLVNRVAIDKAVTVSSMNGYLSTLIEGAWDPVSTNGPGSVRAAWLGEGALLSGFTLRNGSTRGGSFLTEAASTGGGVFASANALVSNCSISNNTARWRGGGAYGGKLQNTILIENMSDLDDGAGAFSSYLANCLVLYNTSPSSGVTAGTHKSTVRNSIVVWNFSGPRGVQGLRNYEECDISHSCSSPLPTGMGNTDLNPVFIDGSFHIPAQSPLRAAGSAVFAMGQDMDGEPWAAAPSIGADEVIETNLIGNIVTSLHAWPTNTHAGLNRPVSFRNEIAGRVSRIDWDFGDGTRLTNASYTVVRSYTVPGTYEVTSTAYNADHPEGISAGVVIQVVPVTVPALGSAAMGTNGFTLELDSAPQSYYPVAYVLQYATNLVDPVAWHYLQTIYSSGGTLSFTDSAATNNPARFYRVLAW